MQVKIDINHVKTKGTIIKALTFYMLRENHSFW